MVRSDNKVEQYNLSLSSFGIKQGANIGLFHSHIATCLLNIIDKWAPCLYFASKLEKT